MVKSRIEKRIEDRDKVTMYIDMLEGSVLMCMTAFNNIRKANNLSSAKEIARVTSEGVESYAKDFTKEKQ